LRQQKGLIEAVYAFEIQFPILLATLSDSAKITPQFTGLFYLSGAARDIAFFVSTDIPVDRLTKTIKNAGGNLLEKVELFDSLSGAECARKSL
jgi:phenylalanyl-tRNA synthetase beta chain